MWFAIHHHDITFYDKWTICSKLNRHSNRTPSLSNQCACTCLKMLTPCAISKWHVTVINVINDIKVVQRTIKQTQIYSLNSLDFMRNNAYDTWEEASFPRLMPYQSCNNSRNQYAYKRSITQEKKNIFHDYATKNCVWKKSVKSCVKFILVSFWWLKWCHGYFSWFVPVLLVSCLGLGGDSRYEWINNP